MEDPRTKLKVKIKLQLKSLKEYPPGSNSSCGHAWTAVDTRGQLWTRVDRYGHRGLRVHTDRLGVSPCANQDEVRLIKDD